MKSLMMIIKLFLHRKHKIKFLKLKKILQIAFYSTGHLHTALDKYTYEWHNDIKI